MGLFYQCVSLVYWYFCIGFGLLYHSHSRYLVLRCSIMCSCQVYLLWDMWSIASHVCICGFPRVCHSPLSIQYILVCIFVQGFPNGFRAPLVIQALLVCLFINYVGVII